MKENFIDKTGNSAIIRIQHYLTLLLVSIFLGGLFLIAIITSVYLFIELTDSITHILQWLRPIVRDLVRG